MSGNVDAVRADLAARIAEYGLANVVAHVDEYRATVAIAYADDDQQLAECLEGERAGLNRERVIHAIEERVRQLRHGKV